MSLIWKEGQWYERKDNNTEGMTIIPKEWQYCRRNDNNAVCTLYDMNLIQHLDQCEQLRPTIRSNRSNTKDLCWMFLPANNSSVMFSTGTILALFLFLAYKKKTNFKSRKNCLSWCIMGCNIFTKFQGVFLFAPLGPQMKFKWLFQFHCILKVS